jgi:mono/diheme cytochrome c family protein
MALSLVLSSAATADNGSLERGAYLVQITGCAGCHSPRTAEGEVDAARRLTGGEHPIPAGDLGRFYPPNITPDAETGLGTWSPADIVRALKSGTAPDGRILSSAMPWRTQYRDLTDADATAIATYLKSLAPVRHQVPDALPPLKVPAP